MSIEANKSVVRRLIEAANIGDHDRAKGLLSADYIDHSAPPGFPSDPAAFTQTISTFRAASPDFYWTLDDIVAEKDRVVLRVTARGTHQGELMGIPPTGKRVAIDGIGLYRPSEELIAEAWVRRDLLGLTQQLGAVPSPAASPPHEVSASCY